MNPTLPLRTALAALALSALAAGVHAQGCTNSSQYPGTTIVPSSIGDSTNISTCSFFGEYSVVGPAVAGGNYKFTIGAGGYITVHEGTFDGPVIGAGLSPLTVTAAASDNLFAHWNSDSLCGTASSCQVTSVQFLLDCTPPSATVTATDDCANNQFTLTVNVTSIGDGTGVDLIYNVNSGADQTAQTGVPVGTYDIGPFTVGDVVNLTVVHSSDPMCNLHLNGLVSQNTCPTIINCGGPPLDQTYCYINNDNNHWHYLRSTPGLPLIIIFSAGTIESANYDHLRIYNGPDNQGTLLYDHVITSQEDLTGLQVVAPSGEIWMENSSDGSVSCSSGSQTPWVWQVGCLDCNPAEATYTVNTDCDAQTFTIDVNLTALGSDPTLDITNNAGAPTVTATATGTYTVGPFPITTLVTLTMVNDNNSLCNVTSPVLTNPLCPSHIVCGDPPLQLTYCYTNNDTMAWHWQATTPGDSLALLFSAGTIEYPGDFGDNIRIYDGPDNNSPLLFQNVTNMDLADLMVHSSGTDIYMEMTSSGFGSCSDGTVTEWAWQVGCMNCAPPTATYTVVTDCDSMSFNVVVDITALGTDPAVDITNDGGALPLSATAPGSYTVGPFAAGDTVVVTLNNDMNSLCSVHSAALTNPLCPTILQCGSDPVQETYCYINNDNHEWHWQSDAGQPLALQFSAGTIESNVWDDLIIYDGPDSNSDTLYFNGAGANDLAGLLAISSGPDIYMKVTSDGSVSCQSGSQTSWAWSIGCLDCTNPAASFSVVEDCIHHAFSIAVNVDSTGSSPTVRIANTLTNDTLTNVPAGITMVGPFPMDSLVSLTVMNATNSLCRVFSPQFTASTTNCVDSVCAAEAFEYCYSNNDTAWFLYQGTDNVPLTIQFLWGQMMAGDFVQIYNGSVPSTGALLWQGNLNGNMAGFAINTTNPEHSMLMRVVSNGSGSCATGEASLPLHWVVQCGAVGVNEVANQDFSMFPNPTTGQLTLRLPDNSRGAMDLRITDLAGRIVHHESFNASGAVNTFDLKDLVSGNYTVTLTTNDWVKSQQLQIIH